uniref:MAM domain-containing protein n=1 Tax=Haemonchus contortus TaxID=6289 RepID=A0A7I4Z014_HAECO
MQYRSAIPLALKFSVSKDAVQAYRLEMSDDDNKGGGKSNSAWQLGNTQDRWEVAGPAADRVPRRLPYSIAYPCIRHLRSILFTHFHSVRSSVLLAVPFQ